MKTIVRMMKDESGATAIEYGLIAALISLMIVAGSQVIGTNLDTTFSAIATNVQAP